MSVASVLNQPWAITPEMHQMICAVYDRHLAGERLTAEEIKAEIGEQPARAVIGEPRTNGDGEDAGYTVEQGVAIIPMEGVLAKKMNLFTAISGGTSLQMLTSTVEQANADPSVHSLLLQMDTPGGEVDGTQQLADAVAACTKPTAASVDGMACSAGMWIASQCDSIWAASDMTKVGSIGVRIQHTDRSKANEASGKAVTHITTGKYKAAGNSDQALSQDDRAYLQSFVDYPFQIFVQAVADGRDMTPDQVVGIAGDANVFFAQQAVDNGLIDGIASFDEVLAMLVSNEQTRISTPGAQASGTKMPGGTQMAIFKTFATEQDFNAVITAAEERGKATATVTQAAVDAARNEGLAAGADVERKRIAAIEALPLASAHAKLVAEMKADGKVDATAAALRILAAEGASRTNAGADRQDETQKPVPASPADPTGEAAAAAAAASAKKPQAVTQETIRLHQAAAKAAGRELSAADAAIELHAAAEAAAAK